MGTIGMIIGWIVFGAIIGLIAQFLVPGKQNLSWLACIGLGIAGSFAGGWLFSLIFAGQGIVEAGSWVASIVGAVILLVIYTQVMKKR